MDYIRIKLIKIRQLGERDYLTLTRLCYAGIYKGQIATYGVYSERNELCAGAIMLFSKKKAIFLFSGLNKEGRDSGGMMYLIDSFIRENQQKHLTLDFEGSNDPNLARFYKSFGSETTTYPHISINNLNSIQKILHSIYKRFKQIR